MKNITLLMVFSAYILGHSIIIVVSRKTLITLCGSILLSFSALLHAGSPVWTFTPLTATSISVSPNSTATVQYLVTNQSTKSHRLVMTPITGIT